MERMFLNNNFHYVEVVPVSNGSSWTVEAMARHVETLYRARNFGGDAVIVWIDREARREPADQIADVIKGRLVEAGAQTERVHILINDKMCENIILADEERMRRELNDPTYMYDFEGLSGKRHLERLIGAVGVRYRETSVGVKLLKKTRLHAAALKSPSVARFLETFDIPCWWVDPAQAEDIV